AVAQRGSDLLEQYKNKQAVAAQQLENDVRDAVAEAAKVAATDPGKATDLLKTILARVEKDETLTPARRDSITRDLTERIRVATVDAQRAAAGADDDARRKAQAAAQRADQDRNAAEQEQLARQLAQVRTLREQGRTDDANRLLAELNQKYPFN